MKSLLYKTLSSHCPLCVTVDGHGDTKNISGEGGKKTNFPGWFLSPSASLYLPARREKYETHTHKNSLCVVAVVAAGAFLSLFLCGMVWCGVSLSEILRMCGDNKCVCVLLYAPPQKNAPWCGVCSREIPSEDFFPRASTMTMGFVSLSPLLFWEESAGGAAQKVEDLNCDLRHW